MPRHYLRFVLLSGFCVLIWLTFSRNKSWHSTSLGGSYGPSDDEIKSGKNIIPDLRVGKPDPYAWRDAGPDEGFREPKVDAKSPYPMGVTKTVGSNYTRCLVIPKVKDEDVSWIEVELGDMIESGLLSKAIYTMDDPAATVKNKGNEVMAYLSYVIDHYEDLPDFAIFMHSHRYAWHNNLILNEDSALMVRHLSPERVTREGYMNLRCHWEPGCPDWMHPKNKQKIKEKEEQLVLAQSWNELFPGDEVPEILAQPCCAQFAVSRERILSIPKDRFIRLRDWVLKTDLTDYLAGRVFEYTWQYIFTASAFHCPSMSACYCDGYGACFGDPEKFDYYFELNFDMYDYKEYLSVWNEKFEKATVAQEKVRNGTLSAEEAPEFPEVGLDSWLRGQIESVKMEMEKRREAALELGKDPRQRAKEAGREWKEGDGF